MSLYLPDTATNVKEIVRTQYTKLSRRHTSERPGFHQKIVEALGGWRLHRIDQSPIFHVHNAIGDI